MFCYLIIIQANKTMISNLNNKYFLLDMGQMNIFLLISMIMFNKQTEQPSIEELFKSFLDLFKTGREAIHLNLPTTTLLRTSTYK